jgi:plastocyanin
MRSVGVVAVAVTLALGVARPAAAVHLFPLFPGDPTGDCAAKMKAPKKANAQVTSEGFFFVDESSNSSTSRVRVGQTVQWEFLQYCHSVTSVSVPKGAKKFTTYGGKGSAKGPAAGQDQLVKPNGGKSMYAVKFTVPGRYLYQCVHHAAVGMTGTVIVSKGAPPSGAPQPPPVPGLPVPGY